MNYDEPDDEEVAAQLEDVMAEIEGLELENSVFEGFLRRQNSTAGKGPRGGSGKQEEGFLLTAAQKCEVGTAQLDVAKREMDEAKRASEKLVDTLRAVLEETESRIAELKKDAYEFKRDVVVGGENPRTGRTVSEKVGDGGGGPWGGGEEGYEGSAPAVEGNGGGGVGRRRWR